MLTESVGHLNIDKQQMPSLEYANAEAILMSTRNTF